MKGKIYVLKNPDTNEIRYIGQTIQLLKRRMATHIYDTLYGNNGKYNIPKTHWFRKLFKQGKFPLIELLEEVERDKLNEREMYWISYYKDKTNLLNLTAGGNTICSKIKKYQKKKRKLIYAFEKKSNKQFIFKSTKEAEKKTDTPSKNIPKAIYVKGMANGYYWSYTKFPSNWKPPTSKKERAVILKSINNELFNYPSINQALRAIGGNIKSHKNGVHYALTHSNKLYKGYYWNYKCV